MTLKNCEVIRGRRIWGFSPGSSYPQIWIRDTATLIAYAKHHYPLQIFKNMLQLFFEHQEENGAVPDWVDISGQYDKNTVSSDQESSLVLAAYEIATEQIIWLKKKIRGATILERLEMALDWVWKYRRDPEWNLISSGLTADWGDVDNSYPDQRATKLSDRSTLVFSTYTQAKYLQAIEKLLAIFSYLKQSEGARIWEKRHRIVSRQTRKHLYASDRGYYLIHLCPSSSRFLDMEKEILATGGNAEAILAGLMNPEQVGRFLKILLKKRKALDLNHISFTLMPPYPKGFFPHPALSHPWHYQNGGQWDWIGARVVKALFASGFREQALAFLLEIARKNVDNMGIHEWENRQGKTLWSALFYSGAAGVIGEAVLSGYLGYQVDLDRYRFRPVSDSFQLDIFKTDQFSVTRGKKGFVDIRHLKNKTVTLESSSGKERVRFSQEGRHRLKKDT
jgi:hypothetical protein